MDAVAEATPANPASGIVAGRADEVSAGVWIARIVGADGLLAVEREFGRADAAERFALRHLWGHPENSAWVGWREGSADVRWARAGLSGLVGRASWPALGSGIPHDGSAS